MRVGCSVLLVVAAWCATAAADPLDKPFGATPAELQAAAANSTETEMLRYDQRYEIDAQRRMTMKTRIVWVLRAQKDVADWQRVEEHWDPSYQGPLQIRARAIGRDNHETPLDPSTIASGPDKLVVDLPGGVGSVVEQELTLPQTALPYAGGEREEQTFYAARHATFTLVAPASLHLRAPIVRGPKKPVQTHAVANGVETWTVDFGKIDRSHDLSGVPDGVFERPAIAFTTATSWAAVAAARRAADERAIGTAPLALPASLAHTPTAVVEWARDTLEGSWQPMLPRRTATEILASKKATREELAIVVVAALRQLGIPAETVVSVARDDGPDLDPSLPGAGRHDAVNVIAHPAGATVWIEPGAEHAPAGTMRYGMYGRHALVVAAGTGALTMSPPLRAVDHQLRVVVTITPAELGGATVVRHREAKGGEDRSLRYWIAHGGDTDASYAGMAKFWRGTLASHTHDAPADLAQPASTTQTVTDAKRVVGTGTAITVPLDPAAVTSDVASELLAHDLDAEPARTVDYAWRYPRVAEYETRIAIPPGYTAPAIVADETRALGPASLAIHRALDGQTLVIRERFEPGKLRITPAEFTALRAALHALREAGAAIRFDETAYALQQRGQLREAAAEAKRMIALHPAHEFHHRRLALVYLDAGMGAAARSESRAAIALDPKAPETHSAYAWVLRHDTLGRLDATDWDRAGALTEARKALAIAPKSAEIQVQIATLLERDARGLLRLDAQRDAIEAWEQALALDPDDIGTSNELLAAMERARDVRLEATARARPASIPRDAAIVVAIARQRGAPAAVAEAMQLRTGHEREEVLAGALGDALLVRDYDLARGLAPHVTREMLPAPQLAVIAPTPAFPSNDPRGVVAALYATTFDPLHHPPAPALDVATLDKLRAAIAALAGSSIKPDAVAMSIDTVFAQSVAIDGAPRRGPWRVTIGGAPALYAALVNGVATLIGTPDDPPSLRKYFALHGPDDADARTVLAWIVADGKAVPGLALWGGTPPTDAAERALAFATFGADPARDVPLLQRCATARTGARTICDAVLIDLLRRARRWAELETAAAAWEKRGDPTGVAIAAHVRAAERLGHFDDADRIATAGIAANPGVPELLALPGEVAMMRGQLGEAIQRLAFARKPDASALAINNLAWLLAIEGHDLADAKQMALTAVTKAKSSTTINTLAAAEVEQGDLVQGYGHVLEAIDQRAKPIPNDADLYVLGRIAEQLGLRDDARAFYKQVAKPTEADPLGTFALAQKRLAQL